MSVDPLNRVKAGKSISPGDLVCLLPYRGLCCCAVYPQALSPPLQAFSCKAANATHGPDLVLHTPPPPCIISGVFFFFADG